MFGRTERMNIARSIINQEISKIPYDGKFMKNEIDF